jgi:hypothetical protein
MFSLLIDESRGAGKSSLPVLRRSAAARIAPDYDIGVGIATDQEPSQSR